MYEVTKCQVLYVFEFTILSVFHPQEQKRRFRRWVHCDSFKGVDLAYSKVGDGVPLRLWRGVVEVPAPPSAVLHRLWEERYACICIDWVHVGLVDPVSDGARL